MHNPNIKSKGVRMSTSNCPSNYISRIQIQVATLVNNYKKGFMEVSSLEGFQCS